MNRLKLYRLMNSACFCITFSFLIAAKTESARAVHLYLSGGSSANSDFQPTSTSYTFSDGSSVKTTLNPLPSAYDNPTSAVLLAPPNPSSFSVLSLYQQTNNWTFKQGQNLSGDFILGNYQALQYSPNGENGEIGASLTLAYRPGVNDPQTVLYNPFNPALSTLNSNLFWIQIVTEDGGANKSKTTFIDNGDRNRRYLTVPTPYYPVKVFKADPINQSSALFTTEDKPRRQGIADIKSNIQWQASLFLAEQTGVNTVTLYNGISWGWTNTFTPASQPSPPPSPPASGSKGLEPPSRPREVCPPDMPPISCLAFGYYARQDAIVDDSIPSFDDPTLQIATLADVLSPSDNTAAVLDPTNASESLDESSFQTATIADTPPGSSSSNASAVPEPSDALGGLVAVGMWGGVSWQKRRKQQERARTAVKPK